ncbi:MAG: chromate transporter [Lachnospiraceae bacterium]|nr:chromate transporter [Lachnospiraceae bacterium]
MKTKDRLKLATELFLFFFKIGFFTFGGGWSIIAEMEKEFVEKKKIFSSEELLDIWSIAKSLPGIAIINVCLIFGYQLGGILCGIAAVFGIVLPSAIILSLVTMFYSLIKDNGYVERAMTGVRAAVVPIILSAALSLSKKAFSDWFTYAVAFLAFFLCAFTDVSNVAVILIGALTGLLMMEVKTRAVA